MSLNLPASFWYLSRQLRNYVWKHPALFDHFVIFSWPQWFEKRVQPWQKRGIQFKMCFNPHHCHLLSASWPLRDMLHCLNSQWSRVSTGVIKGQDWHHCSYDRSAPVEISRADWCGNVVRLALRYPARRALLMCVSHVEYHVWLYLHNKIKDVHSFR